MTLDFIAHPWRARVLAELHARPAAPLRSPARVLHFAFATDAAAAARDREALARFCLERGLSPPEAEARHARLNLSGASLRWESHTEFTTYSWQFDAEPGLGLFQPPAPALAGAMGELPQPGPLLVAVDLQLAPDHRDIPLDALFGGGRAAAAEVEDGAARIATDFAADASGFVRVLVLDRSLGPPEAGALVQSVLEIETYRSFALLGLPESQALSPRIRRIETALAEILSEMRESQGYETNKGLLDRLAELAAELEAGAVASLYRFGATRAYREIVRSRLAALDERPVGGLPTWGEFLARRLDPAMGTCASTEERQNNLSGKLARAAQMLRTRVELELELQNRALLDAMNRRARAQLRLQQTVEGLSVAAIAYYVAGLAGLAFKGAEEAGLPVSPGVATALVVPAALVAVALMVRRVRRRDVDD